MGDPAGIGPEIIIKALKRFQGKASLVVLGDLGLLSRTAQRLGIEMKMAKWHPQGNSGWEERIGVYNLSRLKDFKRAATDIEAARAQFAYIKEGVKLAIDGEIEAMVTGPIHKQGLASMGLPYPGHTEYLASYCLGKGEMDRISGQADKVGPYAMMLGGDRLKVVLATTHLAIHDVPVALNQTLIYQKIALIHRAFGRDFNIPRPKIAVCGLNPHCSDGGMFGREEEEIIAPAIVMARDEDIDVHGPLPGDTVFYQTYQGDFDVVLAMYHDQGLAPLKLVHFDDGVNVTLGLPIIRTSVDHGVAYDISGQGIASPFSMIRAIEIAIQMAGNRNR